MKALVTGATGFVGNYLVNHLLQSGDEVCGTYIVVNGLSDVGKVDGCRYVECDVTNEKLAQQLIADFQPDVVYHLAAIAFVPEAEGNFSKALEINVAGTNSIIRACTLLDKKVNFLFISSAEVYGRSTTFPVTEENPIAPNNNYSLTKIMAEFVLNRYVSANKISGVIVRPFNHIGPFQNDRFVVSSFAKQLALIANHKAEPVMKVGNLTSKRDFSDVRDIVRAYRLAALKGSGVYNLCSGQAYEIQDILDTLIKISGLKVAIKQDPERIRPSDTPINYGSYAKAERELGWHPEYKLEETLRDIYSYWLEQTR